jgi:hypothetical protein
VCSGHKPEWVRRRGSNGWVVGQFMAYGFVRGEPGCRGPGEVAIGGYAGDPQMDDHVVVQADQAELMPGCNVGPGTDFPIGSALAFCAHCAGSGFPSRRVNGFLSGT